MRDRDSIVCAAIMATVDCLGGIYRDRHEENPEIRDQDHAMVETLTIFTNIPSAKPREPSATDDIGLIYTEDDPEFPNGQLFIDEALARKIALDEDASPLIPGHPEGDWVMVMDIHWRQLSKLIDLLEEPQFKKIEIMLVR